MPVKYRQTASRIELSVPCTPQTDYRAVTEALEGLQLEDIHVIQDPRLRTDSCRHFELRSYSDQPSRGISAYEEFRIKSVIQDINEAADKHARRLKKRIPKVVIKVHEAAEDELWL